MRVSGPLLALPFLLAPAVVHADAVWTEPCPFGARESTSHAGPRCEPWRCTTDADCEGGLVCRPLRMCVQDFMIPVGGHGAFLDPPPAPSRVELVVGSCEASETCAGTEEPRPPTSGSPAGEIRCATGSYCARRALPSLATAGSAVPTVPAPTAPAAAAPAAAAPAPVAPAPATNAAPAAEPSRFGCAVGAAGRSRSLSALLASVAMLALALTRRRSRSRARARVGSAALALAVLALGAPAAAQRAALPAPWIETRLSPPPLFQSVALVCGRERAYAREREGRIVAWDGEAWRDLPAIPGDARDGSSLWVSDVGVLYADAGRDLASWDGTRWTRTPVDEHFARPGFPAEMDVDVIAGLGESPWIAGHAAVGLVVDGRVRPFDAGGAWWGIGDLRPFARNDVLLAGRGGLTRFDGTRWAREPIPAQREYVRIHALARDDVWAVGPASALHWDGHAWREESAGIAFPEPAWRAGRVAVSIGGPRGAVHLATASDVYQLGAAGWTRVLDERARSPFAYAYGPVCATERHLLVGETSHVLVRPL